MLTLRFTQVDAAVANGVQHLVYSSGDRGGPDRSAKDPTPVKNFAAKFNIEKHLEQCAASSSQGMTYTILRPVTFFENLVPGMHGKGFARMWEQVGDKRLQMISTKDIGWFAAQALLRPEEYRNQAETLAGDELNHKEAAAIFLQVTGRPMELAPCPVGSALKFFKPETLGSMFQWFKYAGYNANVEACRKAYPKMQDYPTWLRQSSGFAKSI